MAERLLTTVAVCLCGAVGGWGLRAVTGTKPTENPERYLTIKHQHSGDSDDVKIADGDAEKATILFTLPPVEDVIAASGGELRRLLIRFLNAGNLEDIEELLAASQSTDGRLLLGIRTYQDLIFRRAIELDAAEFVVWMKTAESMIASSQSGKGRQVLAK